MSAARITLMVYTGMMFSDHEVQELRLYASADELRRFMLRQYSVVLDSEMLQDLMDVLAA